MKSIKSSIFMLTLLIISGILASCHSISIDKQTSDFEAALQKRTEQALLSLEVEDFDNDAHSEAFAFTGIQETVAGETWYIGNLWFISNELEIVLLSDSLALVSLPKVQSFGTSKVLLMEKDYTAASTTLFWGVKEANPFEYSISDKGGAFELLNETDFLLYHSAIDYVIDRDNILSDGRYARTGRTSKDYYFRWDDEKKDFAEYVGGIYPISDFEMLNGSADVINTINAQDGKIVSILKRDNGIINVNFVCPAAPKDDESQCFKSISLHLLNNTLSPESVRWCSFGNNAKTSIERAQTDGEYLVSLT
jgi:hypothetical protein